MWNITLCNNFVQLVHKESGNSNESKMSFILVLFAFTIYNTYCILLLFCTIEKLC